MFGTKDANNYFCFVLTLQPTGLLEPGYHPCSAADLFNCFVKPFASAKRLQLFKAWQAYNSRLSLFVGGEKLTQWVDGSFVTNKPNPGDIDLVTFLPHYIYEPIASQLIDYYSTFSLYDNGLDAYICPVYPESHTLHSLYVDRRQYWEKTFSSQREYTALKGFLSITL
ncbi:DUF6932 family protein [Fibrella aquatilis]|uniref:DUF6932 family protein n=1 Tax=Fibrella aquatilis TaxID=2817059 RepID=UPI0035B6A4D8